MESKDNADIKDVTLEMTVIPYGTESKEFAPHISMDVSDVKWIHTAAEKREQRQKTIKKYRENHSRSTGEHVNMTIAEKRKQRMISKSHPVNKAKNMISNFWNAHRELRDNGSPQGHFGDSKLNPEDRAKEAQEHEGTYQSFLKTKFIPDVRYKDEDKPHISSLRARVRQALRSPRKIIKCENEEANNYDHKTGEVIFKNKKYQKYSFCGSDLGTHKLFHCKCCAEKGTGSAFSNYGLGIVLWFKYIKMMITIFVGLTILALPQWGMYGSSGKLVGELESVSKLHTLAQLGMANMGEGSTLCVSALESTELALQCSFGQKISTIVSVHYGYPTGLCSCPGTTKFANEYGAALPPDPTFPLSCSDSSYPYSGVVKYSNDQRCCSNKLSSNGKADLSSLSFKDRSLCYSKSNSDSKKELKSQTQTLTSSTSGDDCDQSKGSGSGSEENAGTGTNSYAYNVVKSGCVGKNGCKIKVNDRTTYDGTHFKLCTTTLNTQNASRSIAFDCKEALGTQMEGCNDKSFRISGERGKTLNVVAVCTDESITVFDYVVDKNVVWIVLTITEIVQCMFILFCVYLLKRSTHIDISEQANTVQSIELFTIFLPRIHDLAHDNVYKDIEKSNNVIKHLKDENKVDNCCHKYETFMIDEKKLKASIKHHFERLLSSRKPVVDREHLWMEPKEWEKCNKEKKWPVEVHDIKFGRKNHQVYQLQKKRGTLLHNLSHEMAHLEHSHEHIGEAQLKSMEDHVHKELDKLEDIDDEIHVLETDPTIVNPECAFVTFKKREDVLRAKATYPNTFWFYWCCQHSDPGRCCCTEKRIKAYVPVDDGGTAGEDERRATCCGDNDVFYRTYFADETPAPDNLKWENLTIGKGNRCCRVLLSSIITLILLCITISGSIILKNEALKQNRLYPSVDCKAVAMTQPNGKIAQSAAILDELKLERINSTHFQEKNAKQSLLGCFCGALQVQDPQALYTLDFNLKSVANLTEAGYIALPTGLESQFWCLKWFYDSIIKQLYSVASILLIVIVNMILKVFMKRLVSMEKPLSQSAYSTSLMTKLTLFQFLNTALVTMLVNANLDDFDTGNSDYSLGGMLFNGDYKDFSKGWHLNIGTALLLTMIINLSTPILYYWFLPWCRKATKLAKDRTRCISCFCCCYQYKKETKKVTQGEYESLFLGGPFGLEARYAIVNMVTGVSLVFGPSTPLLYPFAITYLAIQFWGDKYLFINVIRIPDRTDASVALSSALLLEPFVVFRLLLSCWMFSNTSIWQGVNLIDSVLAWVLTNVLGDQPGTALDSESLTGVLSCGTGELGYIAIRAIMTVPHVFFLALIIIVWLLIDRFIVPTMGACLSGTFPCFQKCCLRHITIDKDDNQKTIAEYINSGELVGAEEFDFAALDSFKDDIAAELNEKKLKEKLKLDFELKHEAANRDDEIVAENNDEDDEKFAVIGQKFETYESSSSEEDDDDYDEEDEQ